MSKKRGSVRLKNRQNRQERRQWIGFTIMLVMAISVIVAVLFATN